MLQMMRAMLGGMAGAGNVVPATLAPADVPEDEDPGLDAGKVRPGAVTVRTDSGSLLCVHPVLDALFVGPCGEPLGGIPAGATVVLAGSPGRGKTRTVLEAVARVAASGAPSLLVVAEEGWSDPPSSGRDDLCSRFARIGMFATGLGTEAFAERVTRRVAVLENQVHRGQTWDDFLGKYRKLVERDAIRFTAIDSLGALDPTRQRTGENLASLSGYNLERGVTCLCVGQVRDAGGRTGAGATLLLEDLWIDTPHRASLWGEDVGSRITVLRALSSTVAPIVSTPLRVRIRRDTGSLESHPRQAGSGLTSHQE